MSNTANWSYTNIATVWPITAEADGWGVKENQYGAPYQIACTWEGGSQLNGGRIMSNDGNEFIASYSFYHEDDRVKYGDWIARGVATDRLQGEPIRSHKEWDMSFFGEHVDYLTVT